MNTPIKLKKIVEALHFLSDTASSFYDRETGEICYIEHEYMREEDEEFFNSAPDWQKKIISKAKEIDENPDRFICLPDNFDKK